MDQEEIEAAAETAGEEAAHAAERAVENAAADIQAELEDAQEQLDAAHETAEMIAGAALASEIGRQIHELSEKVQSCLNRVDQDAHARTEMQSELASLRAELSALKTPEPPSIQPPPTREQQNLLQEVAEAVETTTDPATAEIVVDAQPEAENPVVVRAKRRWLK